MKSAMVTTILSLLLCMTACEALQEINSHPENTASTVVDSVREQKEQTDEITDASNEVGGTT